MYIASSCGTTPTNGNVLYCGGTGSSSVPSSGNIYGCGDYAGIILRITSSFEHKHNFGNNGLKTGIFGLKPEVQLATCLASSVIMVMFV